MYSPLHDGSSNNDSDSRSLRYVKNRSSRYIGQISEFDYKNHDFYSWIERFELFVKLNKINSKKKKMMFLVLLGNDGYSKVSKLCLPNKPVDKDYDILKELLSNYISLKPSVLTERYKFKERKQGSNESVNQFVTSLKDLSQYCEFGTNLDDALRDQIICGIKHENIKERLLSETNLTLKRCFELCISMESVLNNEHHFAQPIHLFSFLSSQSKETVEEPVSELDSEINQQIYKKCRKIFRKYKKQKNLDAIIHSLSEDESSVIRTRHEEFVKSMLLISVKSKPVNQKKTGKMFAKLLFKNTLVIEAITQGIDAVLINWNVYLMDNPQFFSYIAAIIAPLLLSQNVSFDFDNLKDSCTSIQPDNSSTFFTEVLNEILSFAENQIYQNQVDVISLIYKKWKKSKYVSLDVFIPYNQINKYIKNDRTGIFLLSIAMYDIMKLTDCHQVYDKLQNWITVNISEEIIKCKQFMRALSIAIASIVCSKQNNFDYEFFDCEYFKLLSYYIRWKSLTEPEIVDRGIQCLCGIQIMWTVFELSGANDSNEEETAE